MNKMPIIPMTIIAVVSFGASWLGNYILNSPEKIMEAVNVSAHEITQINTKVVSLCNDYGQTVSRVDQNLQAIGGALKVNIVSGKANVDPCKIQ